MTRVFFDTNVLLDVLGQRRPWVQQARMVWALAEQGRIVGLVSPVGYTTVFYVLRKQIGAATARGSLSRIRSVFSLMDCDAQLMDLAVAATDIPDFEDAVQYFSAVAAHADCILTRNIADFTRTAPPAITPTQFLRTYAFDR